MSASLLKYKCIRPGLYSVPRMQLNEWVGADIVVELGKNSDGEGVRIRALSNMHF